MRVLENPVVRYNAASGRAKSMRKSPISTSFLRVLCLISPFLPDFCPVLAGFAASRTGAREYRLRTRSPRASALVQPEKHLFLRRQRRGNRRVQRIHHRRSELEMPNQRRRQSSASSAVCGGQRRAQPPLPAPDQVHRRMLAGKPLRRPRQRIAFKLREMSSGRLASAGACGTRHDGRAASGESRPAAPSPACRLRRQSPLPWR